MDGIINPFIRRQGIDSSLIGMTQQIEKRMMREYLDQNYANWVHLVRQRLGALVPPGQPGEIISFEEKYAKGFRRWADVVAHNLTEVVIIEFKVRADIEGVAQLEFYNSLFETTEELKPLWKLPRRMEFVVGFPDPVVNREAVNRNINFIVYQPEWLKEYWLKKTTT